MNATEVVIREVQRDSGFQMRQLFAERVGKPCQTAHLHSHGQVLPFHVASRNVIFVGPSVDDLGYNLRDAWWGVPRIGRIELPEIAMAQLQIQKTKKAKEEKEKFWGEFDEVMSECRGEVKVVIGGDLNGHLGRYGVGYEEVHGGFGYGVRNNEGEARLEAAVAHDLVICNTLFQKKEQH